MSHERLLSLGGRDPSLPLALAALVRDAGPDGGLSIGDLILGYREAFLVCHRAVFGGGDPELTGDQIRENLLAAVLPRLADDGWIVPSTPAGWVSVHAAGDWWVEAAGDREGARGLLLECAQAGFRAREAIAGASEAAVPRVGGSVLEGIGLEKSFRRRARSSTTSTCGSQQGEIVGLLGPNGAGKTTTFYMIVGLIRPDAGQHPARRRGHHARCRCTSGRGRGIGYLAQEPSVFRKLTVEENILAILETLPICRDGAAAPARGAARRAGHQAPAAAARPTRSPAASAAGWRSPARW